MFATWLTNIISINCGLACGQKQHVSKKMVIPKKYLYFGLARFQISGF